MNILHLAHDMDIGGTQQVISQLITGSNSELFNHSVICIDGHVGPLGEHLKSSGIAVSAFTRWPGLDHALLARLRHYIAENHIDVLHCHQYTPYTYGVLCSMLLKARVVYTEHGRFYPDSYTWKRRLINPLLHLMTDRITSISSATRDALARYEWFPRKSIQIIYNGLSAVPTPTKNATLRASLDLSQGSFIFGTVARLDPIKNQAMMLVAFEKLYRQNSAIYLVIVGDGPEREHLESQCVQLGIEHRVRFTGFMNDIYPILALFDVFLLPSYSEGTSMTLLESMAMGIPCVVTDVGGNPEIFENRTSALLCRSNDIDQFANAMNELMSDSKLRSDLANNARRVFEERFDIRHMINAYQAVYQSLARD